MLQCLGDWTVGVAQLNCNLSKLPLGSDSMSWVLRSDGALMHNGIETDKITTLPAEGEYLVSMPYLFFCINTDF